MKKVICSFGTIALIACSVEDAKASLASKRLSTYCGMENTPKQITKEYNAATGETVVTNHNRGLTYTERTDEELREKKAMANGNVEALGRENARLQAEVIALQQELLEGYGKELKRIATFCDQVQAFIK